eukprot:4835355-Lingulodinium_polyedra.AAC.1
MGDLAVVLIQPRAAAPTLLGQTAAAVLGRAASRRKTRGTTAGTQLGPRGAAASKPNAMICHMAHA